MAQKDFVFDDPAASVRLCGSLGENLKILEREFLVTISDRGERWAFLGDEDNVAAAVRAAEAMLHMLRTNDYLDEQSVRYCVNLVKSGNEAGVAELGGESVLITRGASPSAPERWVRKNMSKRSRRIPSSSPSAPPAPARPIWPSPWRCAPSRHTRFPASF